MKVGVAVTDLFTGLYAATADPRRAARRAAHRARPAHRPGAARRAGRVPRQPGRRTTSSRGMVPQRMGNAHPNIVPYQDFPTADGDMILAVGNDGQFAALLRGGGPAAVGRRCALRDQRRARAPPRGADPADARSHASRAAPREWVALLEDAGRALRPDQRHRRRCSPTRRSARAACASSSRKHGSGRSPASPVRCACAHTPPALRYAPPHLGEHTTSVLREVLGLSDDAIEALRAASVI